MDETGVPIRDSKRFFFFFFFFNFNNQFNKEK